jgi:hypothetical protein
MLGTLRLLAMAVKDLHLLSCVDTHCVVSYLLVRMRWGVLRPCILDENFVLRRRKVFEQHMAEPNPVRVILFSEGWKLDCARAHLPHH